MNPETVLFQLIESAIEAKAHYQIWLTLRNTGRQQFGLTMQRFSDFFIATTRAHFDSMTLNLSQLFDKSRGSTSLLSYLKIDKISFTANEYVMFKREIDLLAEIAETEAILKIRNQAVAHKSTKIYEDQIFADADIALDKLCDLINLSVDLVNRLRLRKDWPNGVFESQRFEHATLSILRTLELAHKFKNSLENK